MKRCFITATSCLMTAALLCSLASCNGTGTGNSTKANDTEKAAASAAISSPNNLGDNDFLHNDNYKLVWSDEFNGDSLDTNTWQYEKGFVRNNEPQYYTDRTDNVFVKDGALNIVAKQENYTASDGTAAKYTSGSINSKGKKNFKYGAIEMRAKLPSTYNPAAWPAFWMMGENSYWPYCGETDIMEMYGTDMTKYECTVHWADESKKGDDKHVMSWQVDSIGKIEYQQDGAALGLDWHTYGIEWDEKQMRFYFDDKTLKTVDITDSAMTELHQNNFLLLNMALTSENVSKTDETMFPLTYQVDYVRVFQKK